jgi:hypothetical protein
MRQKHFARTPIEGNEVPLDKLLDDPPPPYILTARSHIIVPCFVHEIQSLLFEPASNSYSCRANGIKLFSFVTSEKLKICADYQTPSRYLLARAWDPRLSNGSSDTHHSSLPLLRQRLGNPFFAMLLDPCYHSRFRRIPTRSHIIVQLELPPSDTYGVRFLHLQ